MTYELAHYTAQRLETYNATIQIELRKCKARSTRHSVQGTHMLQVDREAAAPGSHVHWVTCAHASVACQPHTAAQWHHVYTGVITRRT